jgi:tetratricopeptide (TPR) repeat protein
MTTKSLLSATVDKTTNRFSVLLLTFVAALILGAITAQDVSASPSIVSTEFYSGLLRDGQLSLARGDLDSAIVELELACFGLLDQPELLATGLTYLAAAQGRINDQDGFEKTFRRILEVEDRFGAYSQADLSQDTRELFEDFARSLVPRGYLTTSETFAHLAAAPAPPAVDKKEGRKKRKKSRNQPQQTDPPAETIATTTTALPTATPSQDPQLQLESATLTEESDLEEAALDDDRSSPAEATTAVATTTEDVEAIDVFGSDSAELKGPGPEPAKKESLSDPSLEEATRKTLAEATEKLRAARTASDLQAAMAMAKPLADDNPELLDAQHLVAEIAYMGSNWTDTTIYFERGGESKRAELMFYAAVAYFELGRKDEAARILQRALPRLARDAYVDTYVTQILGESGNTR